MKYYTETIPIVVAEKLKEKGMPIKVKSQTFAIDGKYSYNTATTFADVFDWLTEKNIIVLITPCYNNREDEIIGWVASVNLLNKVLEKDFTFGFNYEENLSWHEAVNAAIEKALTLL